MRTSSKYNKVTIGFHIFIAIFALGIIAASILGFDQLDRAALYLVLGSFILSNSLYRIYQKTKLKQVE